MLCFSIFLPTFAVETSRAVKSAPTEPDSHGGKDTMWKFNYSLQKMSVMNNSFPDFAARFAAASLTSLVDTFNRQVGSVGWTSMRAAHDQALIAELVARGIDVSAVDDGHSTSFAHKVRLDEASMKLVIAE